MALLSREAYKKIEGVLHNRFRMREETARWFAELEDVLPEDSALSRRLRETPGGGSLADTTAAIAIKRAQPPKDIQDALKWLKIIGEVQEHFKDTPKEKLLTAYYDGTPKVKGRNQKVCELLCIETATLYVWRDEIVHYTALTAAFDKMMVTF